MHYNNTGALGRRGVKGKSKAEAKSKPDNEREVYTSFGVVVVVAANVF